MKVTIQVGGRFHAFNLAYQLEKRGYLQKLITSYPKFETVKYSIPKNKIESIIIKEILHRSWKSLPNPIVNLYNFNPFINYIFDKIASRKIEETDMFVGWSSKSLHSLRKAQSLGATGITEHGSAHPEFQENILNEEYQLQEIDKKISNYPIIKKDQKEFNEADYISLPSKFAVKTFLDKGFFKDKLLHIPYGVDLSEFKQIPKKDNIFRIVFAGGMTLQKGVHYLPQAFSELNLPNSELILLGSMSNEINPFFKKYNVSYDNTNLYKFTNKKGSSKIRFLGHKKQSELYKYYSQGSVYVQPSIQDGFGMVIIQAMACGLPVIATTNTGGPDIIKEEENGYVIPIRDVEKLKERLVYLYKHPEERKQMGKSAKETVKTGFTRDDYGDRIVKEYKRIFNERKR